MPMEASVTHQVFFTADSHFGHQAVLGPRLGLARPFPDIEAHDEALIAAWNAAVRPQSGRAPLLPGRPRSPSLTP